MPDCDSIADEYDIWGVGVGAINLKEGWVYFILTGTYDDPNQGPASSGARCPHLRVPLNRKCGE